MKMEIDKVLDFNSLTRIFILSNTPLYLYKNFRRNQTVQELSTRYGSSSLIEFVEQAVVEKKLTLEKLVSIYSVIIALSFKNYSEVVDFFNRLDRFEIQWSKELKEIWLSKARITEIKKYNANYKVPIISDINSKQSSNKFNIQPRQPKISIKGEPR